MKDNLFIFRSEEWPQESYFDTLKIAEDIQNETDSGQFEWQTEGSQTGQEERRKTDLDYIYLVHTEIRGYTVAKLVEALHNKQEGHGFNSQWCHWNF